MTGPRIYQTIHVFEGRPRLLEGHLSVLEDWAGQIFGLAFRPDARSLGTQIARLVAEERYPTDLSGFVRLTLDADGQTDLTPAGISLYRGYALRSLQPDAVTLRYEPPLFDAPTSAREAACALARLRAELSAARIAVRCTSDGLLRSADDAPLFAVRGKTVFTPPAPPSVERRLGIEAVGNAGLHCCEKEIPADRLATLDELFYVDHRGVTALGRCDGRPYMAILAERVAAAMEAAFPHV